MRPTGFEPGDLRLERSNWLLIFRQLVRYASEAQEDGIPRFADGRRTRVRIPSAAFVTKADLHHLVDRLPDKAVDGAAILLPEVTDGWIDPEQAWFWTRQWQEREREADKDLAAGRVTHFESDEDFLAELDERTKPLDADA
jgi:hypothetical protein